MASFVPEYGLAPEHPFPAAVDEPLAAYRGLVKKGFAKIALAGDSSGGGLALVLLSSLVVERWKARDDLPSVRRSCRPGPTWRFLAPVWKHGMKRTHS